MKFFFALLISSALFATVNEPLRIEFFSGYRNDRIHWHIQDPGEGGALIYSEVYRDVESWLNGLTLKVIHRDLTFFIRGAYGAFGKGSVKQRFANLPNDPRFRHSTEGWTADVSGYFGYAVNLTADRYYKVILTPLIGYAGYFEELDRSGSSLPGAFRLVWNGFFLGGEFLFETGGPIILKAGYAYNFLHNRVHTRFDDQMRQSLKTSSGGDGGQTGWAQIDWKLGCFWRMGIGGDIYYFRTRVVDASIKRVNAGDLSEKFKLRWTSLSGWGQISRTF